MRSLTAGNWGVSGADPRGPGPDLPRCGTAPTALLLAARHRRHPVGTDRLQAPNRRTCGPSGPTGDDDGNAARSGVGDRMGQSQPDRVRAATPPPRSMRGATYQRRSSRVAQVFAAYEAAKVTDDGDRLFDFDDLLDLHHPDPHRRCGPLRSSACVPVFRRRRVSKTSPRCSTGSSRRGSATATTTYRRRRRKTRRFTPSPAHRRASCSTSLANTRKRRSCVWCGTTVPRPRSSTRQPSDRRRAWSGGGNRLELVGQRPPADAAFRRSTPMSRPRRAATVADIGKLIAEGVPASEIAGALPRERPVAGLRGGADAGADPISDPRRRRVLRAHPRSARRREITAAARTADAAAGRI